MATSKRHAGHDIDSTFSPKSYLIFVPSKYQNSQTDILAGFYPYNMIKVLDWCGDISLFHHANILFVFSKTLSCLQVTMTTWMKMILT